MSLNCFRILIELVLDTTSISSNHLQIVIVKSYFVFDKLTGSGCAFVSHTAVLDSCGLLRVRAGKLFARLWPFDRSWPASSHFATTRVSQ